MIGTFELDFNNGNDHFLHLEMIGTNGLVFELDFNNGNDHFLHINIYLEMKTQNSRTETIQLLLLFLM